MPTVLGITLGLLAGRIVGAQAGASGPQLLHTILAAMGTGVVGAWALALVARSLIGTPNLAAYDVFAAAGALSAAVFVARQQVLGGWPGHLPTR